MSEIARAYRGIPGYENSQYLRPFNSVPRTSRFAPARYFVDNAFTKWTIYMLDLADILAKSRQLVSHMGRYL